MKIILKKTGRPIGRKSVSKRKYDTLFYAAVGMSMPLVMCFFTTLTIIGFHDGFWMYYLRTYIVSVVLSVPVSMVVLPILKKLFDLIYIEEKEVSSETKFKL